MTNLLFDSAPAAASPESILARPLIVGASVSADYGTSSPGKRLALRYTKPDQIRTIARGGTPGREVIKSVHERDVADRTSLIAVDFLFWDSTSHDVRPSVTALDQLVNFAKAHSIPIVLGEIPELLPGYQPNRTKLNGELAKACAKYSRCTLMPFDQLHRQLMRQGYLEIEGKKMRVTDIVPDGLHLSRPAADFLAALLLEKLGH